MVCVITMAGLGTRFRDAGYNRPKYEIEVHGRPLFDWSLISLRGLIERNAEFIFVSLASNQSRDYVARRCEILEIKNWSMVEIDTLTDGQATTVLAAESIISSSTKMRGLTIFNIDTHVNPFALSAVETFTEASILCFPGAGDAWSFAKTGDDSFAVEVAEKVRISPHASVGLYCFDSFVQYRRAYDETYVNPAETLQIKERYIAPMYNSMIRAGVRVRVPLLSVGDVVPLGTPAEVDAFRAHNPSSKVFGDQK